MWGASGECVLGSNSHCHLPWLCHWVTKMQYVGDLASSDVIPHSCTSYSARSIFMLWLPSIFWLLYLSKNSFINHGLDLWSVRSRMLAAFDTDLSGQIACPQNIGTDYLSVLSNIPEEQRSRLHNSRSLKSCIWFVV